MKMNVGLMIEKKYIEVSDLFGIFSIEIVRLEKVYTIFTLSIYNWHKHFTFTI